MDSVWDSNKMARVCVPRLLLGKELCCWTHLIFVKGGVGFHLFSQGAIGVLVAVEEHVLPIFSSYSLILGIAS